MGEEADHPEAGAEQQQGEQPDDVDRRAHGQCGRGLEQARPRGARPRGAVGAARDAAREADDERAAEQAEVGGQALPDQLADLPPAGERLAEVEVQERVLQVVGEGDEDEAVVAGAQVGAQQVDHEPGHRGHADHDHDHRHDPSQQELPERHPSRGYDPTGRFYVAATWLIACSAIAVIVRLGFTPTLAGIAEPSQTSRFS
jgi:hypothetical protein